MPKNCNKHDIGYKESSGVMRCPECSKERYKKYDAVNTERRKKYRQSRDGKAAQQKYKKSEKGKTTRLAYYKSKKGMATRKRNHNKILARSAVSCATKKGSLIIPDICSECGQLAKVESHHHLGYEKEHRLNIQWLCRSCHLSLHEEI